MRYLNFLFFLLLPVCLSALPTGFVYLRDIDPSIIQEIRYATDHNFVARPVAGYEKPVCILTEPTAKALSVVQKNLLQQSFSLKVYDCYRPKRAVEDFIAWSKLPQFQETKKEFYPRTNKKDFFRLGYVAEKSGHTRGSTVDLTIVSLPLQKQPVFVLGQKLIPCYAPREQRFPDNSIDMGTGYDCLDVTAHVFNPNVSKEAEVNRMMFRELMVSHGFLPYEKEWWHFTLKDEPFPDTYFDFPVA